MTIINKYKIYYQQNGGILYDYFFYRLIGSFITDKKKILQVINQFPQGINETNFPILELLLKKNLTQNQIIELKTILNELKISHSYYNAKKYASIYLSSFDTNLFKLKLGKTILNYEEINKKIENIPNIRKLDIVEFKRYIQYIINQRFDSYFLQDKISYILNKLIKNISLEDETKIIYKDEFTKLLEKIILNIKNIDIFNKELNDKIDKNTILNGIIRPSDSNLLTFDFIKSSNLPDIKKKYYLIYPIPDSNLSESVFYRITINSLDNTSINFKFIKKSISDTIDFKNVILINDIKEISNDISKIKTLKTNNIRFQKTIDENKFLLFKKNYLIDGILYNFHNFIIDIYKENFKAGEKSETIGQEFEEKALFLSVIKICNDNPEIDINTIRIYTDIKINHKSSKKQYQISDLDILILNDQDQIIALGEIKSSIDGIQKGYKQLNKIQNEFLNIENVEFLLAPDKGIKLKLHSKFETEIKTNIDFPENNKYLYLITENFKKIGDFNPNRIKQVLSKLYNEEIIKLENNKFIINESISNDIYIKNHIIINETLIKDDILLTNEIIKKYLGKNNFIIFKDFYKLNNAFELLKEKVFQNPAKSC